MDLIVIKDKAISNYKNWITPQELRIVEMMANGLNSREMAKELGIALKTVEVHRHNILKKTGCRNVALLIATFFRQNLIT